MDVLEDDPAGGRVTRSLRKRLTSIDSEASSRPCTPINTKLSSINELNSSSHSTRMTRRNSATNLTGTPAKTPSKTVSGRTTAARPNTPIESPMRRTTRRRSVSISLEEADEITIVKSEPKLNALIEEGSSSILNAEKRVTRSSSKSPQNSIAGNKTSPKSSVNAKRSNRPGPKSKTIKIFQDIYNNDDDGSEVEVINLEEREEEETKLEDKTRKKGKDSAHNKDIIDVDSLTSDENIDNTDIVETPQKTTKIKDNKITDVTPNKKIILDSPYKTPTRLIGKKISNEKEISDKTNNLDTPKKTPIQPKEENINDETELTDKTNQLESPKRTPRRVNENKKLNDIETQSTISENQVTSITEADYNIHKLGTATDEDSVFTASPNVGNVDSSVEYQMNIVHGELCTLPKKKCSTAVVTEVLKLAPLSPEKILELTISRKKSPTYKEEDKHKETPEKLKSVAFNEYLQEDVAKTMYPRTPASNKRKTFYDKYKSYLDGDDISFQTTAEGNNDSFAAANMENAVSILAAETSIQELKESTKTPTKSMNLLKSMESSTPLHSVVVVSPKQSVASEMHCDKAAEFLANELLVKNEDKSLLSMAGSAANASRKHRKSSDMTIDLLKCSEKLQSIEILSKSLEASEKSPVREAPNKLPTFPVQSPSNEVVLSATKLRTPQKIIIEKSPEQCPSQGETHSQSMHILESTEKISDLKTRTPPLRTENLHSGKKIWGGAKLRTKENLSGDTKENLLSLEKTIHESSEKSIMKTAEELLSPELASKDPSEKRQTRSTANLQPQKKTEIPQFPETTKESLEKDGSEKKFNICEETNASPTFPSSWTQNVTRMANTHNKIDVISDKEKTPNAQYKGMSLKRHSRFESDDDEKDINEYNEPKDEEGAEVENIQNHLDAAENEADEEDEEVCSFEDEEEFIELSEHEKSYKQQEFLLDEAEEADDDYQSGDSMDSEERRELEANEIPHDGHSLGSEDTDEDGQSDEDDDENSDSFIANDSEELGQEEESDNNEHLLEVERKNRKNLKSREYKRILLVKDSDSEEQTEESDSDVPEEFQTLSLNVSKIVNDCTSQIEDKALNKAENNKATNKKSIDTFDSNDEGTVVETHRNAKMDARKSSPKIENGSITNVREKSTSLRKSFAEGKQELKSMVNMAKLVVDEENNDEHGEKDDSADVCLTNNDLRNSNNDESHTNEKERGSKRDNNFIVSKLNEENNNAESKFSEKLLETTLNLKVFDSDESSKDQRDESQVEDQVQQIVFNASPKQIKNKRQQSESFNKTVRDFRENTHESTSGDAEPSAKKTASRRATSLGDNKIAKVRPLRKSLPKHQCSKKVAAACEISSSEDEFEGIASKEKVQKKSFEDKSLNISYHLESSDESNASSAEKVKSSEPNKSFNSSKENNTANNEEAGESILGEVSTTNTDIVTDSDLSQSKQCRSASALSVSFANIKEQKKTTKAKLAHNSFTIEVSVNKRARGGTPEPVESSFSDEAVEHIKNPEEEYSTTDSDPAVFSSAEENEKIEKLQVNADEELLEKIQTNSNGPKSSFRGRKSLVTPKATSKGDSDAVGAKINSTQRRTLCIPADYGDFTTSQSFIESVAERKRELAENHSTKRKRLSKSFCNGTVAGSLDSTDLEEVYHLHKKSKLARNNNAINSSTPVFTEKVTTKNDDIKRHQQILGRCEEILEAANRAKLEAKQNYNKSKVKVPKNKKSKKIEEVAEPLKTKDQEDFIQKQKQIKRKERAKMEIEKALKASADIILNRPKKPLNLNNQQNAPKLESKQLISYELEDFTGASSVSHKKKKSTPYEENLEKDIYKFNSSAGNVVEMPLVEKKKKNHTTEIQLSTGIVRVEPVTPKKQRIQNGFRESPITPRALGFKVRHILTAGQDTPPPMPTHKERLKRKRHNEVLSQELPKPQWTQSGAFIEEDLYPSLRSGSTQFLVSALNGARKAKKSALVETSAHQFKNNALFNSNIPRETSRDLFLRKQRQHLQSHF